MATTKIHNSFIYAKLRLRLNKETYMQIITLFFVNSAILLLHEIESLYEGMGDSQLPGKLQASFYSIFR